MYEAIIAGLSGLLEGTRFLATKGGPNLVMMLVAAAGPLRIIVRVTARMCAMMGRLNFIGIPY
jgi:hypothetical protein